jgi:hypothetical protein
MFANAVAQRQQMTINSSFGQTVELMLDNLPLDLQTQARFDIMNTLMIMTPIYIDI